MQSCLSKFIRCQHSVIAKAIFFVEEGVSVMDWYRVNAIDLSKVPGEDGIRSVRPRTNMVKNSNQLHEGI